MKKRAKKVLLMQSRKREELIRREREEYMRCLGESAELATLSTIDESIPWHDPARIVDGYDAVIIGGSGCFDLDGGRSETDEAKQTARIIAQRVQPLVEYIIENNIALLGICFGHQLVAEIRKGFVVADKAQNKVGTADVTLTDHGQSDRLFGSLTQAFPAQYGHKDSVTRLPIGATVLAQGERCNFSALRYGGENSRVYTTQFHPELNASDVMSRFESNPGYLPDGVDVQALIRESPEASTIIQTFIREIV